MRLKKHLVWASIIALMSSSTVLAAKVTNYHVSTEADFVELTDNDSIADVGSGGTIIFDNDISLTSDITLPDVPFTIDGNGHTLDTKGYRLKEYSDTNSHTIQNLNFINDGTPKGNFGGAIHSSDSDKLEINGDTTFKDHKVQFGGAVAIHTGSTVIFNNKTTFKNNSALGGGGLYNANSFAVFKDYALFDGNAAKSIGGYTTSYYNGGALYNHNASTIFNDGVKFINNSAVTYGGAVYNAYQSHLTLTARNNNVEFTSNTANGSGNGILMRSNSVLNLNASDSASVIFNNNIASVDNGNVININKAGDWDGNISNLSSSNRIMNDAPTSGEIILNADMSGYTNPTLSDYNKVYLYNGTLTLGENGVFFNNPRFFAYSGATLNLINNKIDSINFQTANIDNMNMKIDVDIVAGTADNISATTIDTNNTINITGINVITDKTGGTTVAVDPDNKFNISLDTDTETVSGPVYTYKVINNGDGTFLFDGSKLNTTTQARAVVQQTAAANLSAVSNIAFNRADDVMTIMDTIYTDTGINYDNVNKVALIDGEAEYNTLYGRLEEGQAWFRPFANIENIDLDTVTGHVNSTSYGMVVGYDTPLEKVKKGYKRMITLFGGYNGASQDFENVDLYQNGGFAGALISLYKKDFYASVSTSVGGMGVVENIENRGSSNYGMLTTSVGTKLGYNFHLTDKTRFQLNGQMGYNFVNTQNHTNGAGARINSDPLHLIQMTPGIKLSHRHNDWNMYLSSSVTFNPLNESKVKANDVILPNTRLGEYVEYGIGVERIAQDKINGFLQAMVRNGSRNGVSLQFGIKIPVGKQTEQI